MKEELFGLIGEIRKDRRILSFDEAATKQAVVLRILNCLGWNPFNIDEIEPEYGVGEGKVDYALKHDNFKKVFIEVKKTEEDLEKHQEQLLRYSFQEGVKLAILTNGITWWFYLPLHEGSWEQRKFYTIEMLDQDTREIARKFSDFLGKENVILGISVKNAEEIYTSKQKKDLIKKTIPEAWYRLLNEADESFIELIAETTERLCGYKPDYATIEEFLGTLSQSAPVKLPLKTIRKRASSRDIPRRKQENYTGKSIRSFSFKGNNYNVEYWIEMLKKVCNIMLTLHRDRFQQVLELKGRKRAYFTVNKDELRVPAEIEGTNIFVETNLSANSIVRLTRDVISCFGYNSENLLIEIE